MSIATTKRRWAVRGVVVLAAGFLIGFLPWPSATFATIQVGNVLPLSGTRDVDASELRSQQNHADQPLSSGRVVGAENSAEKFTSIGVTFDQPPAEPVLVRVKDPSGQWGEWQQLEAEEEEGPDLGSGEQQRGRNGTAPLWVKDARGYEVSVGAEDANHDAKVVLVQDEQQRQFADATPLADASQWSYNLPFAYGSRAQWGARNPSYSLDVASSIKLAVVHHSDSGNDYGPADVPGILRSIQAFHMDGRGWSDIGYNFVVDRFGGIWEGRCCDVWQSVVGARAAGFNTNSVGVMVIGDYTAAQPTGVALNAVSAVIGWKLAMFGVDPNGSTAFTSGGSPKYPAGQMVNLPTVVGHQDVGLTSCPGSIEGYLGNVRVGSRSFFDSLRSVGNHNPVGKADWVARSGGSVVSNGWAFDPDTGRPISVIMSVNGAWTWSTVNFWRPEDVFPPSWGQNHGYSLNVPAPPNASVCIFAMNQGPGGDTQLWCGVVK